jgi:hypothetical protein
VRKEMDVLGAKDDRKFELECRAGKAGHGLARILFASKSANESEWMGLRRFGIQLASTRRKTRCGNLVIRVLVFGLRGSGGRWSSEQNQGASARVRNVPAHSWIVCS